MVCKHENFMLAALQIVTPGLESFNDGQQLAIVGLIPGLCRNHLSGEKGHRMPSARIIQSQLTEDSTNSIARNIRLNSDMTFRIKMV